ncbi:MAG: glycosyltransferase family 39 protein [Planctomycetota bacterium]|nr:glycosyltransferase family 39 protein [Planctomycetota bacterium]
MNLQGNRRIVVHLAVLVCLCGLVQVVVVTRATVAGIDAVRFVGIARQIDAVGFLQTVRGEGEQPLFPLALSTTHGLLRAVAGESPSLWATSAQATAAAALVLAVVPVYFIARRLVGPTGGFIAGVFFCVLPEVARLGADGISDSMHLLFFALAFWGVLEYVRGDNRLIMIGAGVSVGLALMTRVEAIVLLPAIAVALPACQFRAETRRTWTKLPDAGGALALGLAIVLGPYLIAVGPGGPRDSAAANAVLRILGRWHPASSEIETATASAVNWLRPSDDNTAWQTADGRKVAFGVKEPGTSIRRRGYAAAAWQFVDELADAFGYAIGALSILGLVHLWRLGRLRPGPAELLVGAFSLLFALAAIRFTAAEGYLNARHLLLLVVLGIAPAGIATIAITHRLRSFLNTKGLKTKASWSLAVVVVLLAATCLPVALRPLHAGRAAHRRAGCWLAGAAEPGVVLDTKGWTDLYSARTTFQYDQARETFADRRLAYVVVQHGDLESCSDRAQTLHFLLHAAAEPAASFAGRNENNGVTVYRWHPERFRRLIDAEQTSDSNNTKSLATKGDT